MGSKFTQDAVSAPDHPLSEDVNLPSATVEIKTCMNDSDPRSTSLMVLQGGRANLLPLSDY